MLLAVSALYGILIQVSVEAPSASHATKEVVASRDSSEQVPDQVAAKVGPLPAPEAAQPEEVDTRGCRSRTAPGSEGEILVCANRPPRFRIDPDLIAAQRLAKEQRRRPKPPENFKDTTCQVVGPAGCMMAPTIDLIRAATVLAEIADKVGKGESVADIFKTGAEKSEYEIYRELKKMREAGELEELSPRHQRAPAPNDKAPAPEEVRDEAE